MDLPSLFIIIAVVIVGLLAVVGFVRNSHSKLATSLRADFKTAAAEIKPVVQQFDASALADIKSSLADAHAKLDAIKAEVVPEAKAVVNAVQTELASKLQSFESLAADIRALATKAVASAGGTAAS